MISTKPKIFILDDVPVRFDYAQFKTLFYETKKRKRIKVGELEAMIADAANVSTDAVHNWLNKRNGPSEIEMVKRIAECLCLPKWETLMKPDTEEQSMTADISRRYNDRQLTALKKVYDACVSFLNDYLFSNGFSKYWSDLVESGFEGNLDNEMYYRMLKKQETVQTVFDQEYFDLHDLEVYDSMSVLVNDGLMGLFEGNHEDEYDNTKAEETVEKYNHLMNVINDLVFEG